MKRNIILSSLVCANLILITALICSSTSLPSALAQNTGLSGDYLVVSGEIQDGYDALYMIDSRTRLLHVFYYDRGTRLLKYAGWRDLERDFRNNRTP